MAHCLRCGIFNQPKANFCLACGFSLLVACPHCRAANRAGALFCQHCGGLLAALSRFACPVCGGFLRPMAHFCSGCGTRTESCPHCSGLLYPGSSRCVYCSTLIIRCPACLTGNRPMARSCRACGRFLVAPPKGGSGDLSIGRSLAQGRYIIQAKIAQGGMSAIYKAQDRQSPDQVVAIKEMNEHLIKPEERPQVRASFQREAEILSRLDHPNLLKVFSFFTENSRYYLVMEFIPGRSLLDILQTDSPKGIAEDRVLAWASQLCDILEYLHSQQPKIIYRDLKPSNVIELTGTNQVKLIDFGIARFHKPGKRKDTITFGTPGYAPPEQHGHGQTDERSDIYALGATLHHLLTGHDPTNKPFNFSPVRTLNRQISARVDRAISKAVAVKLEDRFASMQEMKTALMKKSTRKSRSPPVV